MLINQRYSLWMYYQSMPDIFDDLALPAEVDKQLFIDTLLDEYGEMAMAFPMYRIKSAIARWGKRHEYELGRLWESTKLEYNPLDNYDRYEDYTDTGNGTGHTEAKSAGYDTETLKTDTGADTESRSTFHHSAHMHGNIGVTTSAQMLREQRNVVQYDFYKHASNIFARDLLVGIYF